MPLPSLTLAALCSRVSPGRSWGGNLIFDGSNYHMFVAEMINGCGLQQWRTNSQISHATSPTVLGPYTYRDQMLAPWGHNPHAVQYTVGGTTMYAIFHIGTGTGRPVNCSAAATDLEGGDALGAATAVGAPTAPGLVHTSPSLNGPWTPVKTPPPTCDNPAPFVTRNGTFALLCHSRELYTAPGPEGPWTHKATVPTTGGVKGTFEDAFIYQDVRGAWHVLYHVYNTAEVRCIEVLLSAPSKPARRLCLEAPVLSLRNARASTTPSHPSTILPPSDQRRTHRLWPRLLPRCLHVDAVNHAALLSLLHHQRRRQSHDFHAGAA